MELISAENIKAFWHLWLLGSIIFGLLVFFIGRFIIPAIYLGNELRQATTKLKKLSGDGQAINIKLIGNEIMTSKKMSHCWAEFAESLHGQTATSEFGQERVVRWRSTVPAEVFFNIETLIAVELRTEYFKHQPGILTGIGIIGTFAGLLRGLSKFSVSTDPETVRASLDTLIHGVMEAFFVSASAITLAMLTTFFEKLIVTRRIKQVEELCQLLDGLFEGGAGEEYLAQLVKAGENQAIITAQLKDALVSDIKELFSELINKQTEGISQAIRENLSEPLQKIASLVADNSDHGVSQTLNNALSNFSDKLEKIDRSINERGQSIIEASNQQQTLLASLKQSIAGSEDDALVSQIKLLKSDLRDRLDKILDINQKCLQSFNGALVVIESQSSVFQNFEIQLWKNLENVADLISKSATEQVINALKEVIVDFNNNLTEQFGDNFKALDESVKKLVIWQENYSQQIEQMIEQYKQGVQAITQTEASVAHISEKSAYIPETMNNLKRVMEVNQHQVDELELHLEAFKTMRDKAVEAVPEIRKQVEETVNEITKSVTTASEHYNTLLVESDKYIKQHVEKSNEILEKFVNNTKEGIEAVKTGLISGTDVIGKDLRSSSEEVKKAIAEGTDNFVKATLGSNDSLKKTANELEKQSGIITKQLDDAVADINGNIRDMINKIIEESKTIGNTLMITNTHLNADIKKVQDQVAGNIDQMQNRLESTLNEVFNKQTKEIKRVFDALEDEVKSTVSLTGEAVNKQVAMIDRSMEQEIEKVMHAMGNALAMISKQFTNDYTKLVEAMAAVVNQQIRR